MPADVWQGLIEAAKTKGTARIFERPYVCVQTHRNPQRIFDLSRERNILGIDAGLRRLWGRMISGQSKWPLFIFGDPGTGKTCAALCFLDHSPGCYFTVPQLCDLKIDIQKGTASWLDLFPAGDLPACEMHKQDLRRRIESAGLFVLDEIGCRENVSDHHYETVKDCLDWRHNKPAVFISNKELAAIAKVYDDRIADRLAEGTLFLLAGESKRRAAKPLNGALTATAAGV
jgi:hypothetical protein